MDKREVIKKLKKYKELVSDQIDIKEIILFGSYAAGTAGADSDIDVAVVVDKLEGDFFSTRPVLWKIRRKVDDRIEPILFDLHHDESGFLQEIQRTGIVI
jgi:uncharacterized protein